MDRSKKQLLYSNVFIKPDFISPCEQDFFFSVATGAQREGDPRSFAPPRSGITVGGVAPVSRTRANLMTSGAGKSCILCDNCPENCVCR